MPVRDPMVAPDARGFAGELNFLGYLYDLAVPRPRHCGTSIFHPPRSASA
ncbi:MAG: hypothetical protein AB7O62_17985 [Pirellulales bacterium]